MPLFCCTRGNSFSLIWRSRSADLKFRPDVGPMSSSRDGGSEIQPNFFEDSP